MMEAEGSWSLYFFSCNHSKTTKETVLAKYMGRYKITWAPYNMIKSNATPKRVSQFQQNWIFMDFDKLERNNDKKI